MASRRSVEAHTMNAPSETPFAREKRSPLAVAARVAERLGERIQVDPRDFQPAIVRLQDAPPNPLGGGGVGGTPGSLAALPPWRRFGSFAMFPAAEGRPGP